MSAFIPQLKALEQRCTPSTFVVKSLADAGAGTLRDALTKADTNPGPDSIVFQLPPPPPQSENIIALTSAELSSKGNVTIQGPGAGKLIIEGRDVFRGIEIKDGDKTVDSPTIISGLTIANCKSTGQGGGIYSLESLTLKNVVISGNTANNGGGVDVDGTGATGIHATINDSVIAGNTANNFAGGMFLTHLKAVSINRSVVTGNTATNVSGGGIQADITSEGTGIAITASQILDNTAFTGGGAFLSSAATSPSAKIKIANSIVSGNTSTNPSNSGGGGGLYLAAGTSTITATTFSDNTATYLGGGIEAKNLAALTITRGIFIGNQTTLGGPSISGGGALFATTTTGGPQLVKVTNSQFADNRTLGNGGGIFGSGSVNVTIAGSAFTANSATSDGGALTIDALGQIQGDRIQTCAASEPVGKLARMAGFSEQF